MTSYPPTPPPSSSPKPHYSYTSSGAAAALAQNASYFSQFPTSPNNNQPTRPNLPSYTYTTRRPNSRTRSPRLPSPPYSTSRPRPRPGYIRRVLTKFQRWLRSLMDWARRNPITAGLLTFLPVLATAGIVKGVGWLSGGRGKSKSNIGEAAAAKVAKAGVKGKGGAWGWGFDEFKGFGGSKGGPLDGILKLLHMFVNHCCKLSPSAVPRVASILLELYFLEELAI